MKTQLFVGGTWVEAKAHDPIVNPYDGSEVYRAPRAEAADVEAALAAAASARAHMAELPTSVRRELAFRIADALEARTDEIARVIVAEIGKPITVALSEVRSAALDFRWGGEEVARLGAELLPLPEPRHRGWSALTVRVPLGPVLAISAFNYPMLFVPKLVPALVLGAPCILKPPPQAPSAALAMAEIYEAVGAPAGALSVVPCAPELASRMVADERIAAISFTGSAGVGWQIKAAASGRKKVHLELGGNNAAIIHEDADLASAAQRCALSAFYMGGQVCIRLQRILVDRRVYQPFVDLLVAETRRLKVGDPTHADTVVGPLIDERAATRVESWIAEAVAGGATLLCGGERIGNIIQPAVLVGVGPKDKISCEEVFGPVLVVEPYDDFEAALDRANDSSYGLVASLFTHDLRRIEHGFRRLAAGMVIVNDIPKRSVNFPFGGMKSSGLGREGLKWMLEEYSEYRTLVLKVGV